MLATGFLAMHSGLLHKAIRWPQILCISIIISGIINCSGPYLKNRLHDAADIITLEAQTDSYGVAVQISSVTAGVHYKDPTSKTLGLRGGKAGSFHSGGFTFLFFGGDYLDDSPLYFDQWKPGVKTDELEAIKKARKAAGLKDDPAAIKDLIPAATQEKINLNKLKDSKTDLQSEPILKLRGKSLRSRAPFGTEQPAYRHTELLKNEETSWAPGYHYTRLEFQVGAYLGIRMGFNPGEFLDFLVGLVGLDLYADDAPYKQMDLLKQLKENPQFKDLPPALQKKLLEEMQKTLEEGNLPNNLLVP